MLKNYYKKFYNCAIVCKNKSSLITYRIADSNASKSLFYKIPMNEQN